MKKNILWMVLILSACNPKHLELKLIKTLEDTFKDAEVISGSSALVGHNNMFYIVRDNSNSLYQFDSEFNLIKKTTLFAGSLPTDPKERKKLKPDLEAALVIPGRDKIDDKLLMIPSGSKKNRYLGATINLKTNEVHHVDFDGLFKALKDKVGDVNIEGASLANDQLLLFQRGNSKDAKNAVIFVNYDLNSRVDNKIFFTEKNLIKIIYPDLGKNKGTSYGFTDAITLNSTEIIFLAASEETDSAYLDGDVSGMMIGLMSLEGEVKLKKNFNKNIKLEGLSLVTAQAETSKKSVTLYLVSDADSDHTPSSVYSLTVDLSKK